MRVLLVEDEAYLAEAIRDGLRRDCGPASSRQGWRKTNARQKMVVL